MGKIMPPFSVIPANDHGVDDRPDGYPFRESYMADNDLAVIELLNIYLTPYWKKC
jgi:hypothetical protein